MPEDKSSALAFADNMCKSSDFNCTTPVEAWVVMSRKEVCFEGRKKRPQERGRKKRKKGNRNPSELFFLNGSQARGDCA